MSATRILGFGLGEARHSGGQPPHPWDIFRQNMGGRTVARREAR